jgi:hypothetical protein
MSHVIIANNIIFLHMKNTETLRDTKAAYKGNNLHTLLKTNAKLFHAEQSGI